jgi:hypothetical protein
MNLTEDDKDRVRAAFEIDGYLGVCEVIRLTKWIVLDVFDLECDCRSHPMWRCEADGGMLPAHEHHCLFNALRATK